MTTENKRVAAYLPQPLYNLLGEFKEENSLSESKAIISILAAHFGVAQEVSQTVAHKFVRKEEFEVLSEEVTSLRELVAQTRMDLLFSGSLSDSDGKLIPIPHPEDFEERANSNSDLKNELQEVSHPSQKMLFERTELSTENELSNEINSESLSPLAVAELAERFELKNPKSIDNKRSKLKKTPLDFLSWTKKKDRDGIGWEYHPQEKLYYPVI